jgi:hypothetical protein
MSASKSGVHLRFSLFDVRVHTFHTAMRLPNFFENKSFVYVASDAPARHFVTQLRKCVAIL